MLYAIIYDAFVLGQVGETLPSTLYPLIKQQQLLERLGFGGGFQFWTSLLSLWILQAFVYSYANETRYTLEKQILSCCTTVGYTLLLEPTFPYQYRIICVPLLYHQQATRLRSTSSAHNSVCVFGAWCLEDCWCTTSFCLYSTTWTSYPWVRSVRRAL